MSSGSEHDRVELIDDLVRIFEAQPTTRDGIVEVMKVCKARKGRKGLLVDTEAGRRMISAAEKTQRKIDAVLECVCSWNGITLHRLMHEYRYDRRWVAIAAMRLLGVSYPKCAKALGYQDHTSAMHAAAKVYVDPILAERAKNLYTHVANDLLAQ